MIKNDIRYIIKKIIIGIGICVGLFYLKSCNVYALNDQWYGLQTTTTYRDYMGCLENNKIYRYVINGNIYDLKVLSSGVYMNDTYVNSYDRRCSSYIIGTDSSNNVVFYMHAYNSYFNTYNIPWGSNPNLTEYPFTIEALGNGGGGGKKLVYTNGVLTSNITFTYTSKVIHNGQDNIVFDNQVFNVYGTNLVRNFYNNAHSDYYVYSNYSNVIEIPPATSTILTLTPTPILTDDNSVLLGYSFRFVFDNFDTSNFVYKYRVGNGPTLILSQNNFQTSIRENKTLYVWVENLEGDVIDNESFTISNIGSLYTGSYSIDITYNDIAPYDTQNTGGSKIINRVDLYLKYLPKTNYLKYQYQYVSSGNNLDPQAWVTLNDNNTSVNEYTLPVHDNGTLYARILDSNDNVVESTTFNVDSIGKLKLYGNSNNISNIFTRLKDNIDYSGPISSLILIPVEFLTTIYDSANGVCTSYNFGSLFGTNIVFPCVDLEDYLGSTLWSLIDILSSIGIIFGISRFIKKQYNKFTNLDSSDSDIM